jgi:aspartate carbamoyltransferase catalytic subunit
MILGQHLLGMRQLQAQDIVAILDTADGFVDISRRQVKKVPTLRGRTILNVFYEPSTRTRVSFEIAAKRLSADAINITASGSSAQKGESLLDTAQSLDAMQADAVVLRHPASGAAHFIASRIAARVINGGDGAHEHPTQALLDLLTMRRHFGYLKGLRVAMVGDVLNSRVARSNLLGLATMGAEVRLAGPRTLLPKERLRGYACSVCSSVEEALDGAQVVMALRLQKERFNSGVLPSVREYAWEYGISAKRMQHASPQAILMHPGPINRGIELSADIADSPCSVILNQVEHGVAVRAAVLYMVLAGTPPSAEQGVG